MSAEPAATPVTLPESVTVATVGALDDHDIRPAMVTARPSASIGVAKSVMVWPT